MAKVFALNFDLVILMERLYYSSMFWRQSFTSLSGCLWRHLIWFHLMFWPSVLKFAFGVRLHKPFVFISRIRYHSCRAISLGKGLMALKFKKLRPNGQLSSRSTWLHTIKNYSSSCRGKCESEPYSPIRSQSEYRLSLFLHRAIWLSIWSRNFYALSTDWKVSQTFIESRLKRYL